MKKYVFGISLYALFVLGFVATGYDADIYTFIITGAFCGSFSGVLIDD